MKLSTSRFILTASLLVLCALAGAGCKSTPKSARWGLNLEKTTPASIELDVVGVSAADKPYWQNSVSVDDYWKRNSPVRSGASKVYTRFDNAKTWELKSTDPIWDTWLKYGATELMIIANLPGKHEVGPYDRRRLFLPIYAGSYSAKDKVIRVEVQEEFLRLLTPAKPSR